MDPLLWSALLMICGLVLAFLEVFIPSGGLLGTLSIGSLIAAVTLAFYNGGATTGLFFLTIGAAAVPVILMIALKLWPRTPLGKRVMLQTPLGDELLPDTPERRRLQQLTGKTGTAKSVMLPSGAVLIDGETVDAVSEGMPIEAGRRVRVVEVRGTRVVVRPVEDDEEESPSDNILQRPIESLGLDDLKEPLG